MRRKASMAAFFVMVMVMQQGCQKEVDAGLRPYIEDVGIMYTIQYVVNDTWYTAEIHNKIEEQELQQMLFTLARRGDEVSVIRGDVNVDTLSAKNSIVYTTKSESDATEWIAQKLKEGYFVDVTWDEKTGIYTCTARK